jgi:hypothetical protein
MKLGHLRQPHLRRLYTFAINILCLAQIASCAGRLFTAPARLATVHIIAMALAGMTVILTIALATIHTNPAIFLAIPAYAAYITIILVNRQHQINSLAS